MRNHKIIDLRQLPRLVVHSCGLLPAGESAVASYMASAHDKQVLVARCDYLQKRVYLLIDSKSAKRKVPPAAVEWYFLENDWDRLSRLLGPNAAVIELQYSDMLIESTQLQEVGCCFVDLWNYTPAVAS